MTVDWFIISGHLTLVLMMCEIFCKMSVVTETSMMYDIYTCYRFNSILINSTLSHEYVVEVCEISTKYEGNNSIFFNELLCDAQYFLYFHAQFETAENQKQTIPV